MPLAASISKACEEAEVTKEEREALAEINNSEKAVDYLQEIGGGIVLQRGTAEWEAMVAYSWLNPAMRPTASRTAKNIVLLAWSLLSAASPCHGNGC